MKLSTTLNLFILESNRGMEPYFSELENYRGLGFERLDCIFCNALSPDSPLASDDWQCFAEAISEKSAQLGISYRQCHMPYYDFALPSGKNERTDMLAMRSIKFASILNAEWTVTHPATLPCSPISESMRVNREYFLPFIEYAHKCNIGIAIENMADFPGQGYRRSYCSSFEELCELTDSFDDSSVGICWDFGHANLMYPDQTAPLAYMGSRIKAVHIHDNDGSDDYHLAPYFGNIKWQDVIPALIHTGYMGDLSFEIKRIPWTLPKYLRNAQWKYALAAGRYLLEIADKTH